MGTAGPIALLPDRGQGRSNGFPPGSREDGQGLPEMYRFGPGCKARRCLLSSSNVTPAAVAHSDAAAFDATGTTASTTAAGGTFPAGLVTICPTGLSIRHIGRV